MITQAIEKFGSQAKFCRAVGMKQQFLTQILKGKRALPAKYAFKLEVITNGEIKASDLIPDFFAFVNDASITTTTPQANNSGAHEQ